MALIVGTNSWVTLAEANTYFSTRYGASTIWAGLSNVNKESLLITAYTWINQQSQFSISASSSTAIVKQAQFEAAWYIYKYFDKHEDRQALYAQGVRSFNINGFSESLDLPEFPINITNMLSSYLTGLGGKLPIIERTISENEN